MARPSGVRNHDFEEKRAGLLNALTEFALGSDLCRPSLRQFAIACATSEPNLRHYFGNRQGLVIAILANIGERRVAAWQIPVGAARNPAEVLETYFRLSEAVVRKGGFIRAHAFGIIEGVADPEIGRAYLDHVLDPSLTSICRNLAATPGCPADDRTLRIAAIAILSPVLLAGLHQDLLGGKSAAPIDTRYLYQCLQSWLSTGLEAR
ncbi:MAG: hypothetical protein R3C00_05300 [Hyphomonas sp.]|nr:hypothetical protein [Hyphomonas sp.]MCA8905870.1 hypothetical protein [Hyphomonas sp.]MCB9961012.1 hypothetical protein [Hyphomonas sp.]MCB9970303.1 hypothetical protein [Hyphomonas sp.]